MWVYLALFTLTATAAQAQSLYVESVSVLERGIYSAQARGADAAGVRLVSAPRLLQATTRIPARLGVRFGVRYAVKGRPIGGTTTIEIVTMYPVQGLEREGQRLFEHRYTKQIGIGAPQYSEYQFDESYEVVPGIWRFEFWQDHRKLGEQEFCVFTNEAVDCVGLHS